MLFSIDVLYGWFSIHLLINLLFIVFFSRVEASSSQATRLDFMVYIKKPSSDYYAIGDWIFFKTWQSGPRFQQFIRGSFDVGDMKWLK